MSKQHDKVRAYYKSTNFDYEHFWSGQALALHFGYFDHEAKSHQASLQRMNQVLAGIGGIRPSDSVLDAGCGYGGSSIWLAENIGCKVTGVTLVPYQMKKAQDQASHSQAADLLSFIEGDYANTGLPDQSFNVVWGLESIVHCDDKQKFVEEAYRLLKPGGRLLISEYILRDSPPISEAEQADLEPFLKGWMMPDLLSSSQYQSYFKRAGFKDINVQNLSKNVEPSLRKCGRNAALAMPFVGILKRLGLIDAIRRDYTIANYVLYDSFKAGLWSYKVIVGTKT